MKFKHLKSTLTYKIDLPGIGVTEDALENRLHRDITANELQTCGFVKNPITGELVTPFSDAGRGYSFVLRHDSKIIPAAVVKAEVEKRVAEYLEETGIKRVPGAEKRDIKANVVAHLASKALVKQDYIHAFYDAKERMLYVSGSSKKRANLLTGELVKAFGAVKAETVYFDGVSHGLSTRLVSWLEARNFGEEGEDAFDGFEVGQFVQLSREGETLRYAVDDLADARLSIVESLTSGFTVDKIALDYSDDVDFQLDRNFRLSKISFPPLELADEESSDQAYVWRSESYYRVVVLSAITNKLTEMLKPAEAAGADEGVI